MFETPEKFIPGVPATKGQALGLFRKLIVKNDGKSIKNQVKTEVCEALMQYWETAGHTVGSLQSNLRRLTKLIETYQEIVENK